MKHLPYPPDSKNLLSPWHLSLELQWAPHAESVQTWTPSSSPFFNSLFFLLSLPDNLLLLQLILEIALPFLKCSGWNSCSNHWLLYLWYITVNPLPKYPVLAFEIHQTLTSSYSCIATNLPISHVDVCNAPCFDLTPHLFSTQQPECSFKNVHHVMLSLCSVASNGLLSHSKQNPRSIPWPWEPYVI